jgi:hypothetical protein
MGAVVPKGKNKDRTRKETKMKRRGRNDKRKEG